MINGLDIPSYKKSHGQGLSLVSTNNIKGKGCCIKKQKGSRIKNFKIIFLINI